MFCSNCGAKVLDGAEFCQKCGAKVLVDAAEQQQGNALGQQGKVPTEVPKKKKSKKLPMILGIIVAVVAVIIIAFGGGKNGTDYVATVKAYEPYAESQGMPYTCGEVFDKYIPDAEWSVKQSDDNLADVNIKGTAKGSDKELMFTIQVSIDEANERAKFDVVSVKVDDEEAKEDVFFALFVAYNEKDKDLHNLDELLGELELALHQNSELMTMFTNEKAGVSFQYPASWTAIESDYESKIIELISSRNCAEHRASFTVEQRDYDPYGVFSGDEAAIKDAMNETSLSFLDYDECMLGDVPAKVLRYQTEGLTGDDIVVTFWYEVGSGIYQVSCSYTESTEATYAPIFQMIMDSYMIQAPAATEPSNQLVFNGIPVSSFLGSSVESIMNDWGTPLEYEAGAGINYCTYDGITFNFDAYDAIYTIDIDPGKCMIDGATLDKSREDLLNILGTPTEEGWVPGGYTDVYQMRYEDFQDGAGFYVEFITLDEVAGNVRFWQE